MRQRRNYIYNAKTLLYEVVQEPKSAPYLRAVLFGLTVAGLVALYFWLYTSVLGLDLPKTARLKRENAEWKERFEILDSELDNVEDVIAGIEQRDDEVYRALFGLDEIPDEVKKAGFGGVNRYSYLDELGGSQYLKDMVRRADVLTKRAYLQSTSLDEVAQVCTKANRMISCIPSVPPILPEKGTYRISSPYGRRFDPVYKRAAFHDGIDFATRLGNPVYATGDGVVEKVKYQFFGYGNEVIIDHGFGYKTRYAHLNCIDVVKGQKLVRGQRIGEVGNTGKSTGPHLHYEVLYKSKHVNPYSFMDLSMKEDEFKAMTKSNNPE